MHTPKITECASDKKQQRKKIGNENARNRAYMMILFIFIRYFSTWIFYIYIFFGFLVSVVLGSMLLASDARCGFRKGGGEGEDDLYENMKMIQE